MNLRQVEAFRAVMTAGTVTGAADLLHVSQPAVSRLVADLERSTGLRLFVRAGRRVLPTAEAHAFYREVEKSFLGVEKLRRAAEDIRNLSVGHLRIVCMPALALGFMPKVVRRFLDLHPGVTVSLQMRSSSTVRDWVASQQFDIGLAAGAAPADLPGVVAEAFYEIEGVCALPAGHELAGRPIVVPEDLRDRPFVSLALEDATRHEVDRVFETAGVRRELVAETQYAAAICGFVLAGVGLGIVNPFTVDDFRDRGIVAKPFRPPVRFRAALLRPEHRPESRLVDRFVALLKTCRDESLQRFIP